MDDTQCSGPVEPATVELGRIEAVSCRHCWRSEGSVPRPRPEELPMGPEEARGPEAENGGPGGPVLGKAEAGFGALRADAAALWCAVVLLCCAMDAMLAVYD